MWISLLNHGLGFRFRRRNGIGPSVLVPYMWACYKGVALLRMTARTILLINRLAGGQVA